ncbi:MAG: hypothetical protein K8U03_21065 [Planctomycetia bacterium]|nr:hypothetical protein [Planctomycetia bacterium]
MDPLHRPFSDFRTSPPHGNARVEAASFDAANAEAPPAHHAAQPLSQRMIAGLTFLLQAREYADDVQTDHWDFALELRELRSVDLINSDLRWLVMKGYVEHARETTLPGESQRSFRRTKGLSFTKQTCFVLTDSGVEAAHALGVFETQMDHVADATPPQAEPAAKKVAPPPAAEPAPRVLPRWDGDMQELRVNGVIVKQFKVPAPNQEMILSAFQEENWPVRIDDPLPPHPDQDSKRRLHDTIVSLNRNHKSRFIRFMGDGTGEGVRWTLIADEAAARVDE